MIRRFLTNRKFLVTLMVLGSVLAWGSAGRLRYGYPFRNLFPQTCIYIPGEEVVPTLIVFLIGLGSAAASFAIMFRRSARLRRITIGVILALLTFSVGVYINGAI